MPIPLRRSVLTSLTSRARRLVALGLLVASVSGCRGDGPELHAVADLIHVARWGERAATTWEVHVADPPSTALRGGWAEPEAEPDGAVFSWAVGEASELVWTVVEPRDLELVFRGRPFEYGGAPPQTIRVEVGESRVGSFEMTPGWREYRLQVPARFWRRGVNTLRLVPSRVTSPARVSGSSDTRELTAAWTSIRRADAPQRSGPAGPVVENDRLFLPWDSRLDLFLHLPADAFLDFERAVFRGSGRLQVEVRAEGTGEPVSASFSRAPEEPMDLGTERPGLYRIRLRAVAAADFTDGGATGGVVLSRPRVASSAPPAPEPATRTPADGAPAVIPELPVPEVFVLYVVDTLRADHLSPWSSDRPVPTPHLDALAARSVVFRQTVAQSSWTKASVASIFSGLWPPEHGAIDRNDRLPSDVAILPEILQRAGWRTEAVVTNPNLTPTFGFDRGFDGFEYLEGADASAVHAAAVRRLEAARAEEPSSPLLLYVHVLDPHSPYDPPERWRRRLAPDASAELARESLMRLNDLRKRRIERDPELIGRLHDLYRAEIAFADEELGAFVDLLDTRLGTDVAFLYVSDHGEEFLEHGNLEHGRALHAESIWVPMALRWPGLEPAVVENPVQHLDVLPTLLPRLGVAAPMGLPGSDLLVPGAERVLFSHLHLDGPERTAVLDGDFKAIAQFWPGCEAETGHRPERRRHLYDIRRDPGESVDLADERPVRLGFLLSLIRRQLGDCRLPRGRRAEDVALDAETRRSLEALGYL